MVPARAGAEDLSTTEAALLPKLDSKTSAEILQIAGQLESWRKDVARFRKSIADAKKDADDLKAPTNGADAAQAVLKIARRLQSCSPAIREAIGFDDKLAPLLKRLDRASKIKINRDEFPDVDADDLRAVVAALIQGKVMSDLADALEKGVLDKVKSLRNPAQFASNFIEDKLKNEFLKKPHTFGAFTFKVTQQDYSISVFNKDANVAIVILHGASGIEVKAKGLYFKYKSGLVEPVFDNLTFEAPSADDLLAKALAIIQKKIPDIGVISISKDDPIKVVRGKDGKGSGINFTIAITPSKLGNLGLATLPDVKANVTVDSKGKVDLKAISGLVRLTSPVLLGDTGLLRGRAKTG
jgi:hypothetical protein